MRTATRIIRNVNITMYYLVPLSRHIFSVLPDNLLASRDNSDNANHVLQEHVVVTCYLYITPRPQTGRGSTPLLSGLPSSVYNPLQGYGLLPRGAVRCIPPPTIWRRVIRRSPTTGFFIYTETKIRGPKYDTMDKRLRDVIKAYLPRVPICA